MNERYAKFLQSQHDFPCLVELGKNKPSFGINRWKKNPLRFVPVDDEGFTLHGEKRRLLYKGRRRSHRFTILNDEAFEYDCILHKEPESNVVTLRMEGAENYDIFRQPDFAPDDFLKGSYAVYKKETFVGQGTGKLCHIHRPLIIDALNRKVWGELSVIGNELRITIPEFWLSNAKYPVVVDPTIGTTTVGSQWQIYNDDYDPEYPEDAPEYLQVFSEATVDVSKFTVPEFINGQCTAYFYSMKDRTNDERDCGGRPIFYSDQNNKPVARKSKQENLIDFYAKTINNEGWRSGTFSSNENIPAGSNIWFGCYAAYFWFFRFDYGSLLYGNDWYPEGTIDIIPNLFNTRYPYQINYKVSMYFTYSSAQNYVRTLTQGINLTDARTLKAEYKRNLSQTTQVNDTRNLKADYKREAVENVNGTTAVNPLFTFFRQCFETVGNSMVMSKFPIFNRFVNDDINVNETVKNSREINKKLDDVIGNSDNANRSQGFIRAITENIFSTDDFYFHVLFVRNVQETQSITDTFQQVSNFIRCLKIEAASMAETERSGDFFRIHSDTVNVDGFSFRYLFIFIKLFSTSMVRDFILKRILVSKEQIELKSLITKDLQIESKIN